MPSINKKISVETLASIVSSVLEGENLTAVLSGGAAVSIHMQNRYESMDLDFVSPEETRVIENVCAMTIDRY